jgi:hypothetical protein
MKHPLLFFGGILCLSIGWSITLEGQNENESILVNVESLDSRSDQKNIETTKKVIPKIKDTYRHHKALPETFEGMVIELTTSDLPLQRDYPLFKQFGQVFYDRVKDLGYSYCIIANFSSERALRQYLEQVISPKAPEAKLVEYKNGKRIEK